MSILVTYFSAEGTTKNVAEQAAEILSADLFEIRPEKPYTKSDINWMNPVSRCNREKIGSRDVPVSGRIDNFDSYDTVLIGFPIWYGSAPNVVNTFCRGYDWTGKKIYVFATSGGSGMGKTKEKLMPYVKGGEIVSDKLITGSAVLKDWLKDYGI